MLDRLRMFAGGQRLLRLGRGKRRGRSGVGRAAGEENTGEGAGQGQAQFGSDCASWGGAGHEHLFRPSAGLGQSRCTCAASVSISGISARNWSSACVTNCWALRFLTVLARRSFRWREASRRSVNAEIGRASCREGEQKSGGEGNV